MKALKFKTFLQGICVTHNLDRLNYSRSVKAKSGGAKLTVCIKKNFIIMENEREAQEKSSFKASNHGHTGGRVTKTFSNDISPASYSVCEWLVKNIWTGYAERIIWRAHLQVIQRHWKGTHNFDRHTREFPGILLLHTFYRHVSFSQDDDTGTGARPDRDLIFFFYT